MNKKIFITSFLLGLLINGFLIGDFLTNPVISLDSGFYLSIAKEIYEGKIYFQEIGIGYNPLAITTFGLPFLFDDLPNYRWHLIINILVIIASSIVFCKILNKIHFQKGKNILLTLLFLFLTLTFDGKYLMLEPLSVFFQLLALFLYLDFRESNNFKKVSFVGVFISLSFLAKQYGLFILVPIAIDILLFNKRKFKSILILGVGVLVPLASFYIYLFSHGFGILDFVKSILGKGIEIDTGNGTAINASLISHFIEIFYFILFNLYVLLIPILAIKFFKKLNSQKVLFLLLFLCSLTVLSFATYFHYFLYIIPYSLLLFVYLFNKIDTSRYKKISYLLFGLSAALLLTYSFLNFKNGSVTQVENQRQEKITLNSFIPEKSKVYLDGPSPALYYLCNFKSINLKKISYTFPDYFYPKTIINNLGVGSYLVVSDRKKEIYKKLAVDCELQEIILGNKKYTIIRKIAQLE